MERRPAVRRGVAWIAASLAAAAVVLWAARSDRDRGIAPAGARGAPEAGHPRLEARGDRSSDPFAEDPLTGRRSGEASLPAFEFTEPMRPAHDSRPVVVRGTLRVRDAGRDAWVEGGDGRISFRTWDAPRIVEVTAGRFEVTVPSAERPALRVVGAAIDGRGVRFDPEASTAALTAGDSPLLEGERVPPLRLRVVDWERLTDLPEVEIAGWAGWDGGWATWSPWSPWSPEEEEESPVFGKEHRVLRSSVRRRSPLDLRAAWIEAGGAPEDRHLWLWIRAQAHAWRRIDVDLAEDGDRTVALEPGGTLALELLGLDPSNEPYLLLLRSRAVWHRFLPLGRTSFEIESLPAVPYVVVASMDDLSDVRLDASGRPSVPHVLGRGSVRVPAGGRAGLALALEAPPEVRLVPLAVTLVFPAPAGTPPRAVARRLDPSSRSGPRIHAAAGVVVPGRPEEVAFDFGRVEEGRYEVGIDDAEVFVVVTADGTTARRIPVPRRVTVRVSTIDADTGAPVRVEEATWTATRRWSPFTGTVERVEPTASRFEVEVPPLLVRIEPADEQRWQGAEEFDAATTTEEVTWRVRRAAGIRVRVVEGGRDVTATLDPWPEAHEISSAETERTYAALPASRGFDWTQVPRPGRYRVSLQQDETLEPIEPFEVDVPAGTWVERDVHVVRRR